MNNRRELAIKTLTRVEGEGALNATIRNGVVEQVELNIYEPPRYFEGLLRGRPLEEAPDITARICGICPVAYQMTACQAMEDALGIRVTDEINTLRRLFYCGEWITNHSVHVFLLHLPDFLGYESSISMAADYRELVESGLQIKKVGNQLLDIVGGRAVHPINAAIGGFHRAPSQTALKSLLPSLERAIAASVDALHFIARLDFPEPSGTYDYVSLRHTDEYPMNTGRVVSLSGLDIAIEDYEQHFRERQVAHSTALHSTMLPGDEAYLVGPLARINLCFDQLSPIAKREAQRCRVNWAAASIYQSVIARMLELIDAFEEAICIIRDYQVEPAITRVEYSPRDAVGMHATEAPRGLLYHRYAIRSDGKIAEAKIVPPTSQNQAQIELDLRQLLEASIDQADDQLTGSCERLIRSYDPCISCATHFVKLNLTRANESPQRA
ncbi:MAG: Ni/Fe hydrogenase subunit alpha [Planctomycetota bacterium]